MATPEQLKALRKKFGLGEFRKLGRKKNPVRIAKKIRPRARRRRRRDSAVALASGGPELWQPGGVFPAWADFYFYTVQKPQEDELMTAMLERFSAAGTVPLEMPPATSGEVPGSGRDEVRP